MSKTPRGRKPSPPRTVVNIVERKDGKRRHMYSITLNIDPSTVHRLIYEHLARHIKH